MYARPSESAASLERSRLRVAIVLFLIFAGTVAAADAQCRRRTDFCVQAEYQRARDVTVTMLPPAPATAQTRISAIFECPGKGSCAPSAVLLMLIQQVDAAAQRAAVELAIQLAEREEPLRFTAEFAAQRDPSGSDLEIYSWTMSLSDFLTLVDTKSASYLLAGRPLDVGKRHADGLKVFAKRIPRDRA